MEGLFVSYFCGVEIFKTFWMKKLKPFKHTLINYRDISSEGVTEIHNLSLCSKISQ